MLESIKQVRAKFVKLMDVVKSFVSRARGAHVVPVGSIIETLDGVVKLIVSLYTKVCYCWGIIVGVIVGVLLLGYYCWCYCWGVE